MSVVYFVSVFPSLTETFIFREIRALRNLGIQCRIGQLRPLGATPAAKGFEDLTVTLVQGVWKSFDLLLGLLSGVITCPVGLVCCIRFISRHAISKPRIFVKAVYILLVTLGIAHRLRREDVQHIRSHYLHTEALAAMFFGMIRRVPYSTTCHTVKIYFPVTMVKEIVANAEFVVADTAQVRDFLLRLGISSDRVSIIRNGIDVSKMVPRESTPRTEPRTILAVGRLDEKKGINILLEACAIMKEARVRFHCLIVGDGAQRASLRAQVERLKLMGETEFLGNVPAERLNAIYYQASIFVMSSIVATDGETDGLPTVLIEAMASGVPVVGTRTAAIPEIIQDGMTGLLAEPGDAKDLARAIQQLLGNPELMSKFTVQGRRLVETEYDLARNISALAIQIGRNSGWRSPVYEESIASQ